jgi:hypothetical protein
MAGRAMNAPVFKTRSEQKLEWLEHLGRPLTDQESDELRRSLHAVYCHERRVRMLAMHEKEQRSLYQRVLAESQEPEWYPVERV